MEIKSNVRKFFGHNWVFGKDVQNTLLKNIKDDKRLFKLHHNKQGHGWAIINENKIYELIKENRGFLGEILSENSYPKKMHFDIDKHDENDTHFTLDYIKEIIIKYFGNVRMAISGNATKCSYHIVLPDLIIKDYNHLLEVKKYVKRISSSVCSGFDWKIYTRNRFMKSINQSKEGSEPQKILEDNDYKNHFIVSFFTGNEKMFEIPDTEELYNNKLELSNLPKLDVKLPTEFINNMYNLKNNLLEEVNELFALLLNLNYNDYGHDFTWKIALYCHKLGISFEQFWNWTKNKDNSESRRNKWLFHWNNLNNIENYSTIYGFQKLLSCFYPDLINVKSKFNYSTNKFLQSFADISKIEIKINKIEQQYYNCNEKVIIMNTAMGSGKTTSTIQYLKDSGKSFCWITPRITLSFNTCSNLEKIGIYIVHYKNSNQKDNYKKLNDSRNIIIQTESLYKLKDLSKYEVIIIDEVETVLKSFDSSTHADKIEDNFNNFKKLLIHSKKIILLDAFTTSHTIDLLNSININDIKLYSSDYKPPLKVCVENYKYTDTINKIISDLDNGKKLYIFYAFKNPGKNSHYSIEQLKSHLLENCVKKLKILVYHGDISDTQKFNLGNVNEEWAKYDCIITTSAITVGVNYERDDFDKVYLMMSAYINTVRDAIQSSMRIRRTKENILEVYFFDKKNKPEYENSVYYTSKNDLTYNRLVDNIKIERLADFYPVFLYFCKMTNYNTDNLSDKPNIREKTFINEFYESKMYISYDKCIDIDENNANKIQDNILSCNATQLEKIQLQKYFFNKKYKLLSNDHRKYLWDNNAGSFIDNFQNNIIQMILKDNKVSKISELNLKNIKFTEDTLNEIDIKINSTLKNNLQKIIRAINIILGFNVIKVMTNKTHSIYIFYDELDLLEEIYKELNDKKNELNNCLIDTE
jgi:hypothetical protein